MYIKIKNEDNCPTGKRTKKNTGAGMMDCKNALVETEGDMEKAIDVTQKERSKSCR